MEREDEILGCCGLTSIHDLYGVKGPQVQISIDDARYVEDEGDSPEYSYMLASLNDNQKAEAKVLVSKGFKAIAKFTNASTGRLITIYGLNLNKKPAKKRKK